MSTIKTTNITHGSNSGTANMVLASDGKVTIPEKKLYCPGAIVQVVQGTKSDAETFTSSSLVDIGLSVAITPTASSSKILIQANVNAIVDNSTGYYGGRLQLVRGSTLIAQGDAAGSRNVGTVGVAGDDSHINVSVSPILYLDSPSTTSATTYKIQCAHSQTQPISINKANDDTDNSTYGLRLISTIIAMEVAG